jgi:hypothetical protein
VSRLVVVLLAAGVLAGPALAAAPVPPPPAGLRAVLVHGGYRYAGGARSDKGRVVYAAQRGDRLRFAFRFGAPIEAVIAAGVIRKSPARRHELERALGQGYAPLRITGVRSWRGYLVLDARKVRS